FSYHLSVHYAEVKGLKYSIKDFFSSPQKGRLETLLFGHQTLTINPYDLSPKIQNYACELEESNFPG
ncbi:MAG: hypothetical protein O4860_02735, partial [Trichodesmium sp. St2_bin2_1]|nr:hypothetical protein [Trichodesmium sp. St2_bin2_1]